MDFMLDLEKKSHLQVLENIVSRQGSSQLASSPLKVLASWVLSSPASTLFVIIVIRMHCSQRHFLSSLKTWNMLCCLKVHRSCSTKGFPFLNLTRFTHLCIFAAEASAMFVIKLFDIGKSSAFSTIVIYGFPVYHIFHSRGLCSLAPLLVLDVWKIIQTQLVSLNIKFWSPIFLPTTVIVWVRKWKI